MTALSATIKVNKNMAGIVYADFCLQRDNFCIRSSGNMLLSMRFVY